MKKKRNSIEDSFSDSQKQAYDVLMHGIDNVFITGDAGTGKSYLINAYCREKNKTVYRLASTGMAAMIVNGRTFHSFFGLGICEGDEDVIVKKAVKARRVKYLVKKAEVIVVDEISMLTPKVLACANRICQIIKKSDEIWGGIRIIVVGDFAQLPPVTKSGEKEWVFRSQIWEDTAFRLITLDEMIRTHDEEYVEILSYVRRGEVNAKVRDFLNARIVAEEDIKPDVPRIYTHKGQVDAYNARRLDEIHGPLFSFETQYWGETDVLATQIAKTAPVVPVLQVKVGALVIIRVNHPELDYVNGTVGTITRITQDIITVDIGHMYVDLKQHEYGRMNEHDELIAFAKNFPINLAYAITIHKAQGATLDRACIDLSRAWESGQAYVALSRLKTSEGLYLTAWHPHAIMLDDEVGAYLYGGERGDARSFRQSLF